MKMEYEAVFTDEDMLSITKYGGEVIEPGEQWHDQLLKLECLKCGVAMAIAKGHSPDDARIIAKALYAAITEERWGSEPVEVPTDG